MTEVKPLLGTFSAYDRKKFLLYTPSPLSKIEFTILKDDGTTLGSVKMVEKPSHAFDLEAIDTVMGEDFSRDSDFVSFGKCVYTPKNKVKVTLVLEGWHGFFQRVKRTQMGLSLIIDTSLKAFRPSIMINTYVCILLNRNATSISEVERVQLFPMDKCSCEVQEKATKESLKSLKVFEFIGYHGNYEYEHELMIFFIENAVALEKIVIDAHEPRILHGREPAENERSKESRKHAIEKYTSLVPKQVELVTL